MEQSLIEVSAPSVNIFKERLDNHWKWKDYCFSLDPEEFAQ